MPLVHGLALHEKDVDTLGTVELGFVSPHRVHGDSCTHRMQISLGVEMTKSRLGVPHRCIMMQERKYVSFVVRGGAGSICFICHRFQVTSLCRWEGLVWPCLGLSSCWHPVPSQGSTSFLLALGSQPLLHPLFAHSFIFYFLKIYLLFIPCSVCRPEEGTRSNYRSL